MRTTGVNEGNVGQILFAELVPQRGGKLKTGGTTTDNYDLMLLRFHVTLRCSSNELTLL
jgi:hypothetical protein